MEVSVVRHGFVLLLDILRYMGHENTELLVSLAQIANVSVDVPNDVLMELLTSFFNPEMLEFVSQSKDETFLSTLHSPPSSAPQIALLARIHDVAAFVEPLSDVSLISLRAMLPETIFSEKMDIMEAVQKCMKSLPESYLLNYHEQLNNVQRTQWRTAMPTVTSIDSRFYPFVETLFAMNVTALLEVWRWMGRAMRLQVSQLVLVLSLSPEDVLDLKRRLSRNTAADHITSDFGTSSPLSPVVQEPQPPIALSDSLLSSVHFDDSLLNLEEDPELAILLRGDPFSSNIENQITIDAASACVSSLPTSPTSMPSPPHHPASPSPLLNTHASCLQSTEFVITIAEQPPRQTVYCRILRPNPSVVLISGTDCDKNLFVTASLVRDNKDEEIERPKSLDGRLTESISNGKSAIFKKLKLSFTSQMLETHVRLKFRLQRYVNSQFVDVPGVMAFSHPIETFSHTIYINRPQNAPPPPIVRDIIPSILRCDTTTDENRMVILGANFMAGPNLCVRFQNGNDSIYVQPQHHESGTLIAHAPSYSNPCRVVVDVTNDGRHYVSCPTALAYH